MKRLCFVLLFLTTNLFSCVVSAAGQVDPAGEDSVTMIRDLIYHGEFGEAEVKAREFMTRVTDRYGENDLETAAAMDLLVDILSRAGKIGDGEALALADETIRIKLSELGEDHPDVATSRYYRGWLYLLLGDLDQAEPELRTSLTIRERHLPAEDPSIAQSLNGLGCLYYYRSEYQKAVEALRRAVAIRERSLGPDHPDLAVSLSNLANVYADQGDLQKAESVMRQSLEIRTKSLGSDHPATADSIHNLGLLRLQQGAYVEAWSLIRQALRIWTDVMGLESYEVLLAKHSSALVLNFLGDYEQAAVVFAEVCERITALRGPNHPDLGNMLLNLGNLQHKTGDFNAARHSYEKALSLVAKNFGTAHATYGLLLLNYGVLLGDMGDFGEALQKTEDAITVLTNAYDANHTQVAIGRLSLASHLMMLARQDEAAEQIQVALEILTVTHEEPHPDLARALLHRAESLESTGKPGQAVALGDEALRIFQQALAADHPLVAAALIDRGWYHYRAGNPTAALSDYADAQQIWLEIFGAGHPLLGRLHERKALALYQAERFPDALTNALAAEHAGRIHLQLSMRLLSERQALRYATNRPSGLAVALSILTAGTLPDERTRVYHALINARALVLDEMILRSRRLHWNPTPEQTALLRESQEYRSRLSHLLLGDPQDVPATVQIEQLDFARREQERVERALAAAGADIPHGNSVAEIGIAELQRRLGTDEVLVSFVRFDQIDWPQKIFTAADTVGSQAAYVAFVLRSQAASPALVTLGDAVEIDRLVATWHREASTGEYQPGRSPRAAREAYLRAASQLLVRVWEPLIPHVAEARTVLVVRDGSLNLVNFDVLIRDDGTYLVESGPALRYLSAERDLLRDSTVRGRGLLVLGDPSFEAPTVDQRGSQAAEIVPASRPQLRGLIDRKWAPLPATRTEAEIAVRFWSEGFQGDGEPVVQLLGPEASESMLKQSAPGKKVLHLATHGFFLTSGDAEHPLSPNARTGEHFAAAHAWIMAENPLLMSGLILAGASTQSSATIGQDDGILTAEEIASLNLNGVELAVLSACGTGLGEQLAGEGVFGLQRAFQIAGAGQLVLSLWPVADEDTAEWMESFYSLCAGKKWIDLTGTVRRASLTVLKDRRRDGLSTHPFHWGAFIAVGADRLSD
jgi:tetratricopeptide (TPR) repeat protein/CHAT domain-containing protein